MIGPQYFKETLPLLVAGHGGFAIVRIHTYDDKVCLVRDIIKTHEGSITFNAYIDSNGDSPIVASSSDAYDFDLPMPAGYVVQTIPFENIRDVQVVPASATCPTIYH